MQSQMAVGVGGGLLFGVLLSVAISGTLTDGKIERAVGKTSETSEAAMAAATEGFEARIAELEAALSESAASLDERLVALQTETAVEMAALSAATEGQANDLADLVEQMAQAPQAAPAEAVDLDMPTSEARGVGETAIFADGAVRVFVSAVDQDGGSARVSVNGETQSLSIGASAAVALDGGECAVALADVTEAGAIIGSDCGVETTQATDAAAADIPPAPEDGHTPGTTVSLADGALRVFVSALAADGSSARLAVNGIDVVAVASGTSIDVAAGDQACTLTVTGVGNGMVGLEGSCS
ncbi:hypothetical protein So717_37560 [Roseobacter cerasinus]|uniref:Uncharacterized protein n=1 Tax=Roseobacter cerasinus TaxID=2602289 RepID=A0A640VV21_9RHOB|nr:hypothetical protein [Roseobacter cerasinus]GFE52003.1 hypothetical protein So717_37560 [Roseobacter cerasinus]